MAWDATFSYRTPYGRQQTRLAQVAEDMVEPPVFDEDDTYCVDVANEVCHLHLRGKRFGLACRTAGGWILKPYCALRKASAMPSRRPSAFRLFAQAMMCCSRRCASPWEMRPTAPWQYIDICLQDRRIDVPARCPGGNCVTGKIDDYSRRLKEGKYDRWGGAGDLAFLIHFVGDIHQPLHAANDADRGGNCVVVDSQPPAGNPHHAWDTTIVRRLGASAGTPEATARKLEQTYAAEKPLDAWLPGHTDDIAWESNQIARSDIYAALKIPVEPCEPAAAVCNNEPEVDLDSAYMDHAELVAGHQLAKAGFRLASLLNEIWTQPVGSNDMTRAENSASSQVLSSKTVAGQIVGNRRSKIYAWPGCGSYDTMAPRNRVVFPSRTAAEQAGYRAAYNCR